MLVVYYDKETYTLQKYDASDSEAANLRRLEVFMIFRRTDESPLSMLCIGVTEGVCRNG